MLESSEYHHQYLLSIPLIIIYFVRKIAANSQYPRDRLQAVNLSTRPIEVPKDVTIDTRRDDCLVCNYSFSF